MAYFLDLSPHNSRRTGSGNVVNIGWLDRDHPYPTGDTDDEFRVRLSEICATAGMLLRRGSLTLSTSCGFHRCEFCRDREARCSSEIRVRGAHRSYAAPQLVHHYVVAHRYRPPLEFIEAVLAWEGEIYEEIDGWKPPARQAGNEHAVSVSSVSENDPRSETIQSSSGGGVALVPQRVWSLRLSRGPARLDCHVVDASEPPYRYYRLRVTYREGDAIFSEFKAQRPLCWTIDEARREASGVRELFEAFGWLDSAGSLP